MSTKTRRRHRVAVLAAAGAMALTACGGSAGSSDSGDTTPAPGGSAAATTFTMSMEEELASFGKTTSTAFCGTKPIVLGIQDGFGHNPWSLASMAAVRSEAAKCPNVKEIFEIGEGDLQKSISQINSMVAQGADAIVVIPDFGKVQLPSLQAATNAGVKVVPWGADAGGTAGKDFVTYVDWSSPDAGTYWAEWMVKALGGKGNVAFFGGPAGNPVTTGQLKSIVEVFKKNPGMTLLTGDTDWPVTNWDPATAQQVTASLLAKFPKIDGVISDYSDSALASMRAFQTAGRPLVPLATLDSNGLACLYEKEKAAGEFQLATISSRNWLGRVAARHAIAAAAGITNTEPSTYSLPIIEDTLAGKMPTCIPGLPDDAYNSSQISPADLAKYGTK